MRSDCEFGYGSSGDEPPVRLHPIVAPPPLMNESFGLVMLAPAEVASTMNAAVKATVKTASRRIGRPPLCGHNVPHLVPQICALKVWAETEVYLFGLALPVTTKGSARRRTIDPVPTVDFLVPEHTYRK